MNIITNHVLLKEDSTMNTQSAVVLAGIPKEETMEEYLDDRFQEFMQAIADDGLASIKDIFYNGMQTMLDIMNIAVGENGEESSIIAVMELVEEALSNKVIDGEIDLDYTNSELDMDLEDDESYDDMYDEEDEVDGTDSDDDDTFETDEEK